MNSESIQEIVTAPSEEDAGFKIQPQDMSAAEEINKKIADAIEKLNARSVTVKNEIKKKANDLDNQVSISKTVMPSPLLNSMFDKAGINVAEEEEEEKVLLWSDVIDPINVALMINLYSVVFDGLINNKFIMTVVKNQGNYDNLMSLIQAYLRDIKEIVKSKNAAVEVIGKRTGVVAEKDYFEWLSLFQYAQEIMLNVSDVIQEEANEIMDIFQAAELYLANVEANMDLEPTETPTAEEKQDEQ